MLIFFLALTGDGRRTADARWDFGDPVRAFLLDFVLADLQGVAGARDTLSDCVRSPTVRPSSDFGGERLCSLCNEWDASFSRPKKLWTLPRLTPDQLNAHTEPREPADELESEGDGGGKKLTSWKAPLAPALLEEASSSFFVCLVWSSVVNELRVAKVLWGILGAAVSFGVVQAGLLFLFHIDHFYTRIKTNRPNPRPRPE